MTPRNLGRIVKRHVATGLTRYVPRSGSGRMRVPHIAPTGAQIGGFHMSVIAPERSLQQRMDALETANDIRLWRAQLKRDLKARERRLFDVLDEQHPYLAGMRVAELLLALPGCGTEKTRLIMDRARVSPTIRVSALTTARLSAVVDQIYRYPVLAASVLT